MKTDQNLTRNKKLAHAEVFYSDGTYSFYYLSDDGQLTRESGYASQKAAHAGYLAFLRGEGEDTLPELEEVA